MKERIQTVIVFMFLISWPLFSSALNTGDVMVIASNTDSPDDWGIVALVDLPVNQELRFTDAGWEGCPTSSGAFRSFETAELIWTNTTAAVIPAGTIIRYSGGLAGGIISMGTVTGTAPLLSTGGDQIFIYEGTRGNPTFISGTHFASNTNSLGVVNCPTVSNSTTSTNIPSNLSLGTTMVNLNNAPLGQNSEDNTYYSGPTNFTDKAAAIAALNNISNWTHGNGAFSQTLWPTSFSFGTPLSIGKFSFQAFERNKKVILGWTMESDNKTALFNIERSSDGIHFDKIGVQQASKLEDPLNLIQYKFTDESPLDGISYYRLEVESFQGERYYSELIRYTQSSLNKLQVFPNPAQHSIFVNVTDAQLILYDLTGKMLVQSLSNQMNLQPLNEGTYILKVFHEGNVKILPVIKN